VNDAAGFDNDEIIDLPRMPPSFQNRRIKAFSLGHEHTLALDRQGQCSFFFDQNIIIVFV